MFTVCYFFALTWWYIDCARLSSGHWERFLHNRCILSSLHRRDYDRLYLLLLRDGCGNFLFIDRLLVDQLLVCRSSQQDSVLSACV